MSQITIATVAFALWHSLLCSRQAKELAKKCFGFRRGAAHYRAFFMAQSAVTAGALILYVMTRPHRILYNAKGAARLAGWGGQGTSILLTLLALRDLDTAKFAGSKGVKAFQEGQSIPEAEAQGPEIEEDGAVQARGVFRLSRHPLEWAPIALLFFSPKMKTNWLAFNLLAAAYAVVGALHEEKRLLRRVGAAYAAYQRQVPFFFGKPKTDSQ